MVIPHRMRRFKCFGANCPKHEKIWPRLDNFKSHLTKLHRNENTNALIKRSVIAPLMRRRTLMVNRSNEWYDLTQQNSEQSNPPLPPHRNSFSNMAPGVTRQYEESLFSTSMLQSFSNQTLPPSASPHTNSSYFGTGGQPRPASSYQAPLSQQTSPYSASQEHAWGDNPAAVLQNSAPGFKSPEQPTPLFRAGNIRQRNNSSTWELQYQHPQRQNQWESRSTIGYPTTTPSLSISPSAPVPDQNTYGISPPGDVAESNPQQRNFRGGTATAPNPSLDHIGNELDLPGVNNPTQDTTFQPDSGDNLLAFTGTNSLAATLPEEVEAIQEVLREFPAESRRDPSQIKEIVRRGFAAFQRSSPAVGGLDKYQSLPEADAGRVKPVEKDGKTVYPCPWPTCTKFLSRQCELNKHFKRHSRPYGCTFDKCSKKFGSKNDWKRHECNQHQQRECWRCPDAPTSDEHLQSLKGEPILCSQIFLSRDDFEKHIRGHHSISDENTIQKWVKDQRLGRRGLFQFWCGFCRKVVRLMRRNVEAGAERFDHIDEHFKSGSKIETWLPLEGTSLKGEILEPSSPDDEENENMDREETGTSSSKISSTSSGQPGEPGRRPAKRLATTALSHSQTTLQKKARTSGQHSPELEARFYCCMCKRGPYTYQVTKACIECSHSSCQNCVLIRQ